MTTDTNAPRAVLMEDLTRSEKARKIVDVGKSKWAYWMSSGHFPVFRPDGPKSRLRYVRLSDVQNFIQTGQTVA